MLLTERNAYRRDCRAEPGCKTSDVAAAGSTLEAEIDTVVAETTAAATAEILLSSSSGCCRRRTAIRENRRRILGDFVQWLQQYTPIIIALMHRGPRQRWSLFLRRLENQLL